MTRFQPTRGSPVLRLKVDFSVSGEAVLGLDVTGTKE